MASGWPATPDHPVLTTLAVADGVAAEAVTNREDVRLLLERPVGPAPIGPAPIARARP
jgi:hypothetical protein